MFRLRNPSSLPQREEKHIQSSLLINIILTQICHRIPPDALGGFPSARWFLAARYFLRLRRHHRHPLVAFLQVQANLLQPLVRKKKCQGFLAPR
jgi:hypothetical protein